MNKKQQPKKALLVNIFGALGYISCLFLWAWTGIIFLPKLFENEQVERFLIPNKGEEIVAPLATPTEISPAMVILAALVTIAILVVTVAVVLRAPVTIAKAGKSVTAKVADSALPLVSRGKVLPIAKKRRLTTSLIKLTKLIIILLPILLLAIGSVVDLPLPIEIIALVSSLLAITALLWFSAQYALARLLGVDSELLV